MFVRSCAFGIVDSETAPEYLAASSRRSAPTSSMSSCVITVMLWGESIRDMRTREPEVDSVAVYRPVALPETVNGERTMLSSFTSDWAGRAAGASRVRRAGSQREEFFFILGGGGWIGFNFGS